jgi:Tfp pilus assembly protein PilO
MSKLRGRELYIIVGVVAVVFAVLWYFFLFSPEQKKVADLNTRYLTAENTLQQTNQQIRQLELLKKTAPQAEADLIKMHQVMPSEGAIPSFIVELAKTAQSSGLTWLSDTPQQTSAGVPFSVQPIQLDFDGAYFDAEDFLYRLENYVEHRNGQFLVTGRMFSVVSLAMTKSSKNDYPDLDIKVTINGYQWTPAGASATLTGAQ